MLKKIINKIIMGTKCYIELKKRLKELEMENFLIVNRYDIEILTNNETGEKTYRCNSLIKLYDKFTQNKTKARKIIKLLNANFDKKNETIKQVKNLCNEIIKGE